MANSNFYYNNQDSKQLSKIQIFFREHRFLAILLFIVFFAIIIVLGVIIFIPSSENNPPQEIEDAPYLVIENENLLDHPLLDLNLNFFLNQIILSYTELQSAPTNNDNSPVYTVIIDPDSFKESFKDNHEEFYTVNLHVSDGREYILHLLIDVAYQNEYAVVVLDRVDSSSANDYIITFTSETNASDPNSVTGFITNEPLLPIPTAATDWISSLHLTTPETYHTTLPQLH